MSAIPLLRVELERFADRYRLTAREHDVVYLLVTGFSTVPQIAEQLGLSQNTVHNHFKNVFRRTHTNTKAGLLSLFINETLDQAARVQPLVKHPRVLLAEPDRGERSRLVEALRGRGLATVEAGDADSAMRTMADSRVDLLVADAGLHLATGQGLVGAAIERFGRYPRVLAVTEVGQDAGTLREQGAAEVFEKPLSSDRVTFAVLENFIDSPYERNRLRRVEAQLPANVDRTVEARIGNLGFGGAFVAISDDVLSEPSRFRVGSRIDIEFVLEDREPIVAQGEVMWRRSLSRPATDAGVGVRFVSLPEAPRAMVEDFVRRRKLRNFVREIVPTR